MIGNVCYPISPEDADEIKNLAINLGIEVKIEEMVWNERDPEKKKIDIVVSYYSCHPRAEEIKDFIDKSQEKIKNRANN